MNSNITKAREVLARWRTDVTKGTWGLLWDWSTFTSPESAEEKGYVGDTVRPHDARLIVGIAGNPDLLDAIDTLLSYGETDDLTQWGSHSDYHTAALLAKAIVAADERMSA